MSKHNIVIKFSKSVIRARNNQIISLKDLNTQDNFLNQFVYRSIVDDTMLSIPKTNTINYNNLTEICYVEGLDNITLEEAKNLAKKMAFYDFVEYAYVETPQIQLLSDLNSINASSYIETDLQLNNPYFISTQGYKDGITEYHKGIDMEYAWSLGIAGQGVRCAAIEPGFNFDHINLKRDSFINLYPEVKEKKSPHASAISGIMYANDIGYGLKGLVHDADAFYATTNESSDRLLGALLKLFNYLVKGDVISISLSSGQLPLDTEPAFWDVTRTAIMDGGLIICIAGGDAASNLDADENLKEWRNRPDSGLIRVGGGNPFDLRRLNSSNYSSMIHLQGWGHRITTTGGDIDVFPLTLPFPLEDTGYTFRFNNGSSSATPIVASAAIAVQSWYKQQTGQALNAVEMRQLLVETGTPQTTLPSIPLQHIGPLPNIRNAIEELKQRL